MFTFVLIWNIFLWFSFSFSQKHHCLQYFLYYRTNKDPVDCKKTFICMQIFHWMAFDYYFSLLWGFHSNFIHFCPQRKTDVFQEQNGFPNLSVFLSCIEICLSFLPLKYIAFPYWSNYVFETMQKVQKK